MSDFEIFNGIHLVWVTAGIYKAILIVGLDQTTVGHSQMTVGHDQTTIVLDQTTVGLDYTTVGHN